MTRTTKHTTAKKLQRVPQLSESATTSLQKWSLCVSALYFIQSIVILVLSISSRVSLTLPHSAVDQIASAVGGSKVYTLALEEIATLNLAYVISAIFLVLSAVSILAATVYKASYIKRISNGLNIIRWAQLAVSVAGTYILVAFVNGVQDVSLLVSIVVFGLLFASSGLLRERFSDNSRATLANLTLLAIGLLPWIFILGYIIGGAIYGAGSVPQFVYWIDVSAFILTLMGATAIVRLPKMTGSKWGNVTYQEKGFMIFTMVLFAAVSWQIFFGALRP